MSKLRNIVTAVFASIAAVGPVSVLAQGFGPVSAPSGLASGNDLPGAILRIVNVFLVLIAIVAVIFIIIGGVQYITSRGDEGQAQTAKQTVLYAVIGLIVVGLSAVIVNFVVGAVR